MRKRVYVALLCAFFFVAFVRKSLHAQTAFVKVSPTRNFILWSSDYQWHYTFSWTPASGVSFTQYILKLYSYSYNPNGDSWTYMNKQFTTTATSLNIDFSTIPGLAGSTNYGWSVCAANGGTCVKSADEDSSGKPDIWAFRLPTYTADTKTWTIKAQIICPDNKVLNHDVYPFWTAFLEFQNHPFNFGWKTGPPSKSMEQTVTISNRTDSDSLYLGLDGGIVELVPTGTWPWAANMDDQTKIYRTRAFNPPTNLAEWRRGLPNGTYIVPYAIPAPYDQQWCVQRCTDSDGGRSYTVSGNVTGGGNNACAGGICKDSCSGTNLTEWYCENDLNVRQETIDCPSGSCSNGACAPGICIPSLTAPANNARITNTDPVIKWTQCTGAPYSQINITGTGVDKTITTAANTRSYTLSGLGFQTNNTYTWKMRSCVDANCSTAGDWSTPNTFKYYVCTKSTGDADCENGTDDNDYVIWKCEYLAGGKCDSLATDHAADFDNNGIVDLVDFEIWRSHRY